MDMKSVKILSETMDSLHNIVEQLDSSVYGSEPENFEPQTFCASTPNAGEVVVFFPSSPSVVSPGGQPLSPVSMLNETERNVDGGVQTDVNMISLAKEQNFRIRKGSNTATASQVDTYSITKGGDLNDKDNISFDRQQTLTFDVPKKQRADLLSVENVGPKSPTTLQDEKASKVKKFAPGSNMDIDYLLDVGHWDLNEPEPLNPNLILGALYNDNKDADDDAEPDYEPEERDALNWLKRKRLEFGHFANLLNEM